MERHFRYTGPLPDLMVPEPAGNVKIVLVDGMCRFFFPIQNAGELEARPLGPARSRRQDLTVHVLDTLAVPAASQLLLNRVAIARDGAERQRSEQNASNRRGTGRRWKPHDMRMLARRTYI